VTGPDAMAIGEAARRCGAAIHELRPIRSSLEEVYSRLTDTSVQYRAHDHGETVA
jgi:ABC-2 type transport system ATP-binding protein